ncbi:MAG: hypothetical protein HYR68_05915, partial [Burkholderiales bacterium]|nr:hypothetical protein [Burkholderiales bacterium]
MDGQIYSGYFIVSIKGTVDGDRYMTLVGNEVQMHTDPNRAMLIRLYSRRNGGVLTTGPIKLNGTEGEFRLDLVFNGDIGHCYLIPQENEGRRIDFPNTYLGTEGGQVKIMLGGSILGSSAGHDRTSHLFRLHPDSNPMFRPNPWTFKPAPVSSFANGDLR